MVHQFHGSIIQFLLSKGKPTFLILTLILHVYMYECVYVRVRMQYYVLYIRNVNT